MLDRVVLSLLIAALPTALWTEAPAPLMPVRSGPLPYDLTGFVVEPGRAAAEQRAPMPQPAPARPEPAPPQVAAHEPLLDEGDQPLTLVYDLRGFLPPYPAKPREGPLDYDLGGLLGVGSP